MEPLKNRQIIANRRSAPREKSGLQDVVSLVQTSQTPGDGLAIADDVDLGNDPYNSAGQHCIIKARDLVRK